MMNAIFAMPGMGGENLNYGDMDKVGVTDMR